VIEAQSVNSVDPSIHAWFPLFPPLVGSPVSNVQTLSDIFLPEGTRDHTIYQIDPRLPQASYNVICGPRCCRTCLLAHHRGQGRFLSRRDRRLHGRVFFIEHKVPGLIIGAVANGDISVHGYGERPSEGSGAPDGDTVMRLGSSPRPRRPQAGVWHGRSWPHGLHGSRLGGDGARRQQALDPAEVGRPVRRQFCSPWRRPVGSPCSCRSTSSASAASMPCQKRRSS
jgi:hypothetical protein